MAKKSQTENFKTILKSISVEGCLLVYPLKQKENISSIWETLYGRQKMNWDWSSDADNRVAQTWILREQLARSGQIIYSKWFKNRATFFSLSAFEDLLVYFKTPMLEFELPRDARNVYEALLESSPVSSKELKLITGLKGKSFSTQYDQAIRELFLRGLIVGFGEVDDGAFPSLNIGATKSLFEQLWNQAQERIEKKVKVDLSKRLPLPAIKQAQLIFNKYQLSSRLMQISLVKS